MAQNNHEIFKSMMDTSDGKGMDGVMHPDLKAKADNTRVASPGERATSSTYKSTAMEMGKVAADVMTGGASTVLHAMDLKDVKKDSIKATQDSVNKKNTGKGKSIIDRD